MYSYSLRTSTRLRRLRSHHRRGARVRVTSSDWFLASTSKIVSTIASTLGSLRPPSPVPRAGNTMLLTPSSSARARQRRVTCSTVSGLARPPWLQSITAVEQVPGLEAAGRGRHHLAELATEAGATVRSGVRVTGALSSGGVLTQDGPVRASVTVFADGVNSAVRRIMPTMRNPWEVAWGLAQLLESPGLGKPLYCEVRFGSFAPGWRAQLNPLGGSQASLWTFVRGVSR